MSGVSTPIEYRELRRRDLPTYESVIAGSIGELERATGLDRATTDLLRSLRRPGIWILLRLMRLFSGNLRIFVGARSGRVLGTTTLILQPEVGVVVAVATDPRARGQGIASHLVEHAHRVAVGRGKRWTALDVDSDNETAQRVYRKLGYSEAGEYSWHAGPMPGSPSVGSGGAVEVNAARLPSVVAWVQQHRPEPARSVYPSRASQLTHLELLFRLPGVSTSTWELFGPQEIRGVIREYYLKSNRTSYLVPAGWAPDLTDAERFTLFWAAASSGRSNGATRLVFACSDPQGGWERTIDSIGIPRVTSSILMVRSADVIGAGPDSKGSGTPPAS